MTTMQRTILELADGKIEVRTGGKDGNTLTSSLKPMKLNAEQIAREIFRLGLDDAKRDWDSMLREVQSILRNRGTV